MSCALRGGAARLTRVRLPHDFGAF